VERHRREDAPGGAARGAPPSPGRPEEPPVSGLSGNLLHPVLLSIFLEFGSLAQIGHVLDDVLVFLMFLNNLHWMYTNLCIKYRHVI
jgi:hypothetical protein